MRRETGRERSGGGKGDGIFGEQRWGGARQWAGPISVLTGLARESISRHLVGDGLQGAAADCNSAEVTHAWFDSRVAHHFHPILSN